MVTGEPRKLWTFNEANGTAHLQVNSTYLQYANLGFPGKRTTSLDWFHELIECKYFAIGAVENISLVTVS